MTAGYNVSSEITFFIDYNINTMLFVGDKSEILDIDNPDMDKFPLFNKATKYECQLEPGDVLFIPGMSGWILVCHLIPLTLIAFLPHIVLYFQINKGVI